MHCFPNTLMDNYYNKKASGLQGGESVKLHYIDPDGVDQGTVFPNGVKIGWFLLNDSFYGGNNKPFYSTTKLNGDGRTHTAAFRIDDLSYCPLKIGQTKTIMIYNSTYGPTPSKPSSIRIFLISNLTVATRIRNTVWNTKESSLSKIIGPERVTMT